MKTLKFISAFIFIAICFSNVQSQLASWSDSQGGYSLNYMEIANDVPFSCNPTGPCFTNCPSFVVSTCDTIYLKFELSISTVNTTGVSADFEIQRRPIGGSTNWLPVFDDAITGFCSIDKPQVNCCLKTYTYAIPMGNSYEYRIIIDPQWSSASGSTTFYNVDFYRPVVDLGFNLLNASSQTTNPTEPEIVCIDDDMILEVSPEFAQYLASFHNAYFGNDFILEIHKTDEEGIILDSEIIDDFDLDADYWTGSGFDLNELTDGWFEASGYYLIKLFDDGSSCYTDSDNYLWVELVNAEVEFYLWVNNGSGGQTPSSIPSNNDKENPLISCGNTSGTTQWSFVANSTGAISEYDYRVRRYDNTTLDLEGTILPFRGFTSTGANALGDNYLINGDIANYYGGFFPSIPYQMPNWPDDVFEITILYKNICGTSENTAYFKINGNCKTSGNESLNLNQEGGGFFEIFPNPSSSHIHISHNSKINDIKIMDNIGRLVYQDINIDKTDLRIDVSNFVNGIYFILVNDELGKFIKQ